MPRLDFSHVVEWPSWKKRAFTLILAAISIGSIVWSYLSGDILIGFVIAAGASGILLLVDTASGGALLSNE